MFENCRGTIQNGIPGKVPGTDSPLEMKATYLEVKATYMYSSSLVKEGVAPPAFGEEQLAGTIIYRFWLGENAVDNYDVVRNKHYMVTLRLKGWGGLVEEGVVNKEDGTYREGEDVSWRVDTNLTTGTTVLEQDKLDVPACGSVVEIILTGDFGGATTISYTSTGNNNFVWLKKKDKKSGGWIWGKDQSTTDYATSVEEMGGGTYKIKCFVEPVGKETFNGIMAANPTLGQWKEKGKRSTGFKITGNGVNPFLPPLPSPNGCRCRYSIPITIQTPQRSALPGSFMTGRMCTMASGSRGVRGDTKRKTCRPLATGERL